MLSQAYTHYNGIRRVRTKSLTAAAFVIAQARNLCLFLFEFTHFLKFAGGVGSAAGFAVCITEVEMGRRVVRTKFGCAFQLHDRFFSPVLPRHHLACQGVSSRETWIAVGRLTKIFQRPCRVAFR